ncbi:MAG: family 10 glycosylhydrolase [Dysgonamonadaceae bacterium]|jgi:hypothetical protein|nr:family 10 glycosylhydrolase [Dysgonamonadaceae bacterium]
MKNFLLLLLAILFSSASCSKQGSDDDNNNPDIPIDIERPEVAKKPVQMWIDVEANFSRFATKANITAYLERMKETGFTEVYLDVKPGIGYALYSSDILPQLTIWGDEIVERDWDYLQYWIDETERLDMSVIASISTFGFGYTRTREGLVYNDSRWDGKTQVALVNGDPNNMEDIRDRVGVDAAFLNPADPEVQAFVMSVIEEIVTKYPKLKGFCFDYCRWYNNDDGRWYGFEDKTLSAFASYIGRSVNKNDIITAGGGTGPLFAQWIEFRSMTITNFIINVRSRIKAINPDIEVHLWASAHWDSRYTVAQNWASKRFIPTGHMYTETYHNTGFADQLDVFSLGAYAEAVWIKDNPGSQWSVENFVTTYDNYTMGDCKVMGSIATYAQSYRTRPGDLSDAIFLCLTHTDGLMVFEISHVIHFNQWATIKEGIDRYYRR